MATSSMSNFIGFYSYQIFSANKCFTEPTVQEINRYENGKLKNDFLFPKQLTNYFGCTLIISARIFNPLLIFNGDRDNTTQLTEMKRLTGIEGQVLKLLAKSLNFSIQMRFSREESTINMYLNSTGCFKDLEQKTAHVAIGGLSSTINNNEKFTKTFAHYTTPFKFVVRNNVFYGSIKQLKNPFHHSTWIALIILLSSMFIFIRVTIILKLTKVRNFIFGHNNKNPVLNTILIFLGYSMSARVLPKRNFARYMLMLWLLFALVMRTAYQGKMFDSLRQGQRKPLPKTINELIAMDYKLLSSVYRSFYPYNKTLIWKNSSTLFTQLQSSEKPLTVAVILDALAAYNLKNRYTSSLTAVDETIFSYQCVIYFRKNSLLRESFERKLKFFAYSGISSYIAKQYVRPYSVKDVNPHTQIVSRITLGDLRGLFLIFYIMCNLAFVIFILELLKKKSMVIKAIMDWLN